MSNFSEKKKEKEKRIENRITAKKDAKRKNIDSSWYNVMLKVTDTFW
jgi:hypothetical protein